MAAECKICKCTDDYNYSLNMGLCNVCVETLILDLQQTVRWMLKDIDYRNEQTGIDKADSPEVALARKLIE